MSVEYIIVKAGTESQLDQCKYYNCETVSEKTSFKIFILLCWIEIKISNKSCCFLQKKPPQKQIRLVVFAVF